MSKYKRKIIDLTHTLDADTPVWDNKCGFQLKTMQDYPDFSGIAKFRVQEMATASGIGTHIDAPAHCIEGGNALEAMDISNPFYSAIVIDVSHKTNASYQVNMQDISEFEKKYRSIEKNSVVLFYTGWDKFWNNPAHFSNNFLFPSVSSEVGEYLNEKKIAGIGIDTFSPDVGESDFPVHRILLSNNRFILENVANLSAMPTVGGEILVLPLKIKGGTEGPLRLIGMYD